MKSNAAFFICLCLLGILFIGMLRAAYVSTPWKSYYRVEMYQDSFKVIDPEDKRVIGVYPYSDSSEISKALLNDNL